MIEKIKLNPIEHILRLAVFFTFIGHGYLALIGNKKWVLYLETVGFSFEKATILIPVIGVLDILVAISILFKPQKYIVIWAVLWAFSTALIRPFAGESIWSFIERGANWGAPLALYFILKNNKNV